MDRIPRTPRKERRAALAGRMVVVLAFLYVLVATATFAFRHPWMTSTEQIIWVGRALAFGTVDYDEARPRR